MGIFDGNGQAAPLSEEAMAVFAADEQQESQEATGDGYSEEQAPQEETSLPPNDPETVHQGAQEEAVEEKPVFQVDVNRYREMQAAYQAMKVRTQALESQLEQVKQVAAANGKVLSSEEQKAFAEEFLTNPAGALQKVLGEQIKAQAEQAAKSVLEPLQQQAKLQQVRGAVETATKDLEQLYPQAAQSAERVKMFNMLGQLAEQAGLDRDGWTNNPAIYLQQAALRLYGLPKQVDQAAIDKAVEQGKANALAELQARDAGKNGLAPASVAAPQGETSAEEQILAEIRAASGGGGLFH